MKAPNIKVVFGMLCFWTKNPHEPKTWAISTCLLGVINLFCIKFFFFLFGQVYIRDEINLESYSNDPFDIFVSVIFL